MATNQKNRNKDDSREMEKKRKAQSNGRSRGKRPNRGQPKKDSDSRRINADNARIDKVEDAIAADSRKPEHNDPKDFSKNPEILKAAGSIPFASILGNGIKDAFSSTVPGIMTIYWTPSTGAEPYPVAWNKADKEVLSYLIHANSRTYAYNYCDLGILLMAGFEVFCAIQDAIRAYGVIKSYTEPNKYLVDALLYSMGWNPTDLHENINRMWFDINDLILSTKDIWVPDIFPVFRRWMNYSSYVYTDAEGERSQMYVYVRDTYFMLSETSSQMGSCLVPVTISLNNTAEVFSRTQMNINEQSTQINIGYNTTLKPTRYTWSQFVNMVRRMINALNGSKSAETIYGDLMNAYGPEKIFSFAPIDSNFIIRPVYNSEILAQIENLTISHVRPMAFVQDLGDDSVQSAEVGPRLTALWSSPGVDAATAPEFCHGSGQVLNVHIPGQPDPELVAVLTRMKTGGLVRSSCYTTASMELKWTVTNPRGSWTIGTYTRGGWTPSTCGSEIPIGVTVTQMYPRATTSSTSVGWLQYPLNLDKFYTESSVEDPSEDCGESITGLNQILNLMAFDWHPFLYYSEKVSQSSYNLGAYATTFYQAFGDYDNYTWLSDYNLDNLNIACLYSLFGIPQAGFSHKYLQE